MPAVFHYPYIKTRLEKVVGQFGIVGDDPGNTM